MRRALARARLSAQPATPVAVDPLHRPFDEILDIYVRDGLVYYFALKQERGKFDRYVAVARRGRRRHAQGLAARAAAGVSGSTPTTRSCLRTVIDAYPIRGKSADYPANSIRQIPGAFERRHVSRRRPHC